MVPPRQACSVQSGVVKVFLRLCNFSLLGPDAKVYDNTETVIGKPLCKGS